MEMTSYLQCSADECGAVLELHERAIACPKCGDLLEVAVKPNHVDPAELKRQWLSRRTSYEARDASGVWRFRDRDRPGGKRPPEAGGGDVGAEQPVHERALAGARAAED